MTNQKPFVLIILDGWGYRETKEHNAIAEANTPFFDHLWAEHPHTTLNASEESVGLPEGQVGNSEIGHTTIGAGKIIDTDLVRITKAAKTEGFENNTALVALFEHVKKHNSTLHLQGLLSPGGVHSHQEHLHELLRTLKKVGIEKVAIHAFTDGRDTAPQSAHHYLAELETVLEEVGIGFIASASGRFYAMDRDNNWDRLAKVEAALFRGEGKTYQTKRPSTVIAELHKQGMLDEHLEPIIFLDDTGKNYIIQENDGVVFFNFRPDRARMLAKKMAEEAKIKNLCFVTLTEYEKNIECLVAFNPIAIETTLAAEISRAGLTQVHIAETEKYAHATYFLNGGREELHPGETHVLIESRKDVLTHDLAPEMRAKEITEKALEHINTGTDFIFINFANADMVGHTANQAALKIAVETIDAQLKQIVEAVNKKGGTVFITADHGNAELNLDPTTGQKHTAHTSFVVPAILTQKGLRLHSGTLADVAPTVLELMRLKQPESMTGKSIIE